MTNVQRAVYERVSFILGDPDRTFPFAFAWSKGDWKVTLNIFEDGTTRVLREGLSSGGVATWESFEPRYMIDVLLARVVAK